MKQYPGLNRLRKMVLMLSISWRPVITPLINSSKWRRKSGKNLLPETTMVANVGDFTRGQAGRLKNAGFSGVYHAVRLGEGTDTSIPVETRLQTFRNAAEAGLLLGTCLEPVGTEHTISELVQKTIITREANPVYSGAARRIPLPGTAMASHGMVSEARMAHILAVVRLALGFCHCRETAPMNRM